MFIFLPKPLKLTEPKYLSPRGNIYSHLYAIRTGDFTNKTLVFGPVPNQSAKAGFLVHGIDGNKKEKKDKTVPFFARTKANISSLSEGI